MFFLLEVSLPKFCMHFSSFPHLPYAPPISFFLDLIIRMKMARKNRCINGIVRLTHSYTYRVFLTAWSNLAVISPNQNKEKVYISVYGLTVTLAGTYYLKLARNQYLRFL